MKGFIKVIVKTVLGASTLGIGIKLFQLIYTTPSTYTFIPYGIDAGLVIMTGLYVLANTINEIR